MIGPNPLCLDFANAVAGCGARATDRLQGYGSLVAWARRVGLLSGGQARALAGRAGRQPAAAASAMRQAVRLGEAVYRVVATVAARRPTRAVDLEALNAAIGAALARSRLAPHRGGFGWERAGDGRALDRMLWPVARSAAEVLTSADLDAIRQCAAPDCGRLFLDASRNRSRRWCDMASCGNRDKVRRHYARSRSIRARSAGGKS